MKKIALFLTINVLIERMSIESFSLWYYCMRMAVAGHYYHLSFIFDVTLLANFSDSGNLFNSTPSDTVYDR